MCCLLLEMINCGKCKTISALLVVYEYNGYDDIWTELKLFFNENVVTLKEGIQHIYLTES